MRPLLDRHFGGLPHAAALLGPGSEVLGYDDATSTDHHWGARVQLFVPDGTPREERERISDLLAAELPVWFLGHSTHFVPAPDDPRSLVPRPVERGPVQHRVEIMTPRFFFLHRTLGVDPGAELEPADWLSIPQQSLLSVSRGAIFHDGIGLGELRARFRWYPRDVWLYLLAAVWTRIGQEEHFVGRCGSTGDELGSRLLAGRLVRDVMRLCFLMERRYAPYPKWFGRAFRELEAWPGLGGPLGRALEAAGWREREAALAEAYGLAARMHNALELTPPLDPKPREFFGRGFRVIDAGRFAAALRRAIQAPERLPFVERPLIGSIDQFADSTDLLAAEWRTGVRGLYL